MMYSLIKLVLLPGDIAEGRNRSRMLAHMALCWPHSKINLHDDGSSSSSSSSSSSGSISGSGGKPTIVAAVSCHFVPTPLHRLPATEKATTNSSQWSPAGIHLLISSALFIASSFHHPPATSHQPAPSCFKIYEQKHFQEFYAR
uniref:HDC00495 n=1 Tax=Drosophila melanogaster TaxID=7227 RepID=Q6IHW9_DROME|nr:TPA_inf: HDC00495 [Drosophila melanogaster]